MADFFADLHDPNAVTWADFERDLRAAGRSERTIQSYGEAAAQLANHCKGADLLTLRKADIADYLAWVRASRSSITEQVRFRSLHRFYAWAAKEIGHPSPMAGMSLPKAEEKIVSTPARDDLRKVLAACAGQDFDSVRDTALLRLMAETGLRLAETASLTLTSIDQATALVTVLGKGSRWRQVPYGRTTAKALSKYLRARQRHDLAHLEGLWLGSRGMALKPNGIAQMLRRRCRQAGISPVHPHQLRHYCASEQFHAGLSDQDAMRLFGWSSLEMPRRYGAATGARRAIAHARALAIGDRL